MERFNNLSYTKETRRHLRNNPTPAEALLWQHLRKSQLHGRKFRRQHGIGRYILDFYCPAERLAVEVDGADHSSHEGHAHDEKRTVHLRQADVRVIWFWNQEVMRDTEAVLETIASHFRTTP